MGRCSVLGLALFCGGCGLVLDLDPQDGPGIDAALRDGGSRDAGRDGDAGTQGDAGMRDGGVRLDASLEDAGIDGGPMPCSRNAECQNGEYCARRQGVCYGSGVCQSLPTFCSTLAEPVCGCDWQLYINACSASRNGVGVMQAGSCPTITNGEWCEALPTGSDPEGCPFCFDDNDCGGLLPICVSSSCAGAAPGICAFGPPPPGDCYDRRQCQDGERCVGAVIDVCAPTQGTCEVITP